MSFWDNFRAIKRPMASSVLVKRGNLSYTPLSTNISQLGKLFAEKLEWKCGVGERSRARVSILEKLPCPALWWPSSVAAFQKYRTIKTRMAAVSEVLAFFRKWISEHKSWIEHCSRTTISFKASHITGSKRTEVRRPKTVIFRLTRVVFSSDDFFMGWVLCRLTGRRMLDREWKSSLYGREILWLFNLWVMPAYAGWQITPLAWKNPKLNGDGVRSIPIFLMKYFQLPLLIKATIRNPFKIMLYIFFRLCYCGFHEK